jgi:hypothetical protein
MELKTKIIWILWTIIYILNITSFRRTPIGYSNKTIMDISYSNIYFTLTIIILFIQIYYAVFLTDNFPPVPYIRKYWSYLPLLIGVFLIINYKKKPIEDNTKFFLPPKNISKHLIAIYIIIIISLIILLLLTRHVAPSILLILTIYFLKSQKTFYPCKYNLPNTLLIKK